MPLLSQRDASAMADRYEQRGYDMGAADASAGRAPMKAADAARHVGHEANRGGCKSQCVSALRYGYKRGYGSVKKNPLPSGRWVKVAKVRRRRNGLIDVILPGGRKRARKRNPPGSYRKTKKQVRRYQASGALESGPMYRKWRKASGRSKTGKRASGTRRNPARGTSTTAWAVEGSGHSYGYQSQAKAAAQKLANETGRAQMVYASTGRGKTVWVRPKRKNPNAGYVVRRIERGRGNTAAAGPFEKRADAVAAKKALAREKTPGVRFNIVWTSYEARRW